MIVANQSHLRNAKSFHQALFSSGPFAVFQRSLSSRRILRKYPLLATLHRSIDGALIGVLISAALISSLSLHSKHLWTLDFSNLEMTRKLNRKLQDSILSLEHYFLDTATIPKTMVTTKSTDLLYVDGFQGLNSVFKNSSLNKNYLNLFNYPIRHGY